MSTPSVNLAYLILTHGDIAGTFKLVNALSSKADFIIHYDAKSPDTQFEVLQAQLPQAHFVRRRHCYWGDISLVEATLESIRTALTLEPTFDYAFLLSGSDYPLVANTAIEAYLTRHWGKEFLSHIAAASATPSPFQKELRARVRGVYFPKNRSVTGYRVSKLFNLALQWALPERRVPGSLDLYGGSQWWCLSREALAYTVEQAPKLLPFFRTTRVPDEAFFQTALLNSPFEERVINDNLRYVDWSGPVKPAVLTAEDLPALRASGALFARKFHPEHSKTLLELIDAERAAGHQDV